MIRMVIIIIIKGVHPKYKGIPKAPIGGEETNKSNRRVNKVEEADETNGKWCK